MITPEWISIVAPFASGAAGIGVAWGIIRQKVIDLDSRLGKLETKVEKQVGESRCDHIREDCKQGVMAAIGEVKQEQVDHRDKHSEIDRFIGKHNGE